MLACIKGRFQVTLWAMMHSFFYSLLVKLVGCNRNKAFESIAEDINVQKPPGSIEVQPTETE